MTSRKLGPELRILLASGISAPDERVDILLRVSQAPEAGTWAALASAGLEVRTIAGDVLTASAPVHRLEEIAGLEEVAYVELSRPMGPERGSEVTGSPDDV